MTARGLGLKAAVVLAGLAMAGGCAPLTQPPPPPDAFYRLDPPTPSDALAAPVLPGMVEVVRFTADGLTAERALVYAMGERNHVLGSYSYHLWTDSPTSLLQEALVAHLRAAGAAETVVTSNLRLRPDYVIQGHIRRFEQAVGRAAAGAATAEVVVAVELAVTRPQNDELLLLRTYEARRRADDDSPEAAAAAMSAAVGEVFDAFVTDLAALDA